MTIDYIGSYINNRNVNKSSRHTNISENKFWQSAYSNADNANTSKKTNEKAIDTYTPDRYYSAGYDLYTSNAMYSTEQIDNSAASDRADLARQNNSDNDGAVKDCFTQSLEDYLEYVKKRILEGNDKFQLGDFGESDKEWNTLINKMESCLGEILQAVENDKSVRDMKEETELVFELKEYQKEIGDMESYQYSEKLYEAMINEQAVNENWLSFFQDLCDVDSIHLMPSSLHSGIVGMSIIGEGEDVSVVTASYADYSTISYPVMEIAISSMRGGEASYYQVNLRNIDPQNATQMELFALCSYADKKGFSGIGKDGDSYMDILYVLRTDKTSSLFEASTISEFTGQKKDWAKWAEEQRGIIKQNKIDSLLTDRLNGNVGAPYSHLADENGIIEYQGVVFVCDSEHNALCLGDMSNPQSVITIPLSKGGFLKVNRNNIGDLAKAISMFSAEDINLIMRAIAQDAKIQKVQKEIDDMESSIGEETNKEEQE